MSDNKIPVPLQEVVNQIAQLPGLGPKSALRIAMTFLKWPEAETRRLGKSIHDLRDNLGLCNLCGALTDLTTCYICTSRDRNAETLCLVSDWDSMLTLESGGFYKGLYLILGGLLAPLDNITPETLEIAKLEERLRQGKVQEIIFALGTKIESETTASFIKNRVSLKFPQIKITRLAQGIPLGAEVRFMDKETLRQSLNYRQQL